MSTAQRQEPFTTEWPATGDATAASSHEQRCRLCGGGNLRCLWPSNLDAGLDAKAFRITDGGYGRTAAVYRCDACGFRQCSDLGEVLGFYQGMDDPAYEATRAERALQARKLLGSLPAGPAGRRLLDVGAGSGITVAEALRLGYRAEGVEPSRALHAEARRRGLPVHLGVLPHEEVRGSHDVVTLVDVVEHVADPLGLLRAAAAALAPDGVLMVVTPDVGSVPARLMGRRWWHYRVAHVGYFDRHTLTRAVRSVGLEPISITRPSWYFPLSYLAERGATYLPAPLRPRIPAALGRAVIRLNLRDSLLMICRHVAQPRADLEG
jgi:SAM-dependent methyltransferase